MNRKLKTLVLVAMSVIAVCLAVYLFTSGTALTLAGLGINTIRSSNNPVGTYQAEVRLVGSVDEFVDEEPGVGPDDEWGSYNKTLTSERFSGLSEINRNTVADLKVRCEYDTGQITSFQTGLLMIHGRIIGTTEQDIFALDPNTCEEIWRTSDLGRPSKLLNYSVNRGAAYMDGRLFRGSQMGLVLAYDFETGERLWSTEIADINKGETVPAAPIAWNGLVFIGNAGGDNKGVKGRMYAIEAETGNIVWESYLVPREEGDLARGPVSDMPKFTASTWENLGQEDLPVTGGATWTSYSIDPATGILYVPGGNPAPSYAAAVRGGDNLFSGSLVMLEAMTGNYIEHYEIVPNDYHDWDVSNPPTIFTSRGGAKMVAIAPKDGHMYGFKQDSGELLYRTPVTRVENVDEPFSTEHFVHFCPGGVGGAEWNGAAFNPETNLLVVGEVDWCTKIKLESEEWIKEAPLFQPWTGNDYLNPLDEYGQQDPKSEWGGWIYAVDADTGIWQWRGRTNYPLLGGVTPTAGGLTLFGDAGGNFYAVDSRSGEKLWGQKIGGAIGGGVITYDSGLGQRIAVATGMTSIVWPVEQTTAKVVVLSL